ncbi:flavin reductase family protein [Actinopolyspora halophila]|uniref:flavin reductase family protein n=1 Tax=Actinopolyspora halophila TaxID=1850 RepID=UPI00036E6F1E|nr:flavin reductase family protein [Actinopolyspora halophila]
MSRFATGSKTTTCDGADASPGATVNVFIAVSLDRRTKICRYVDGAPFTVNVLTEPQDKVALHDADKQDVLTAPPRPATVGAPSRSTK